MVFLPRCRPPGLGVASLRLLPLEGGHQPDERLVPVSAGVRHVMQVVHVLAVRVVTKVAAVGM